MPAEGRCVDGVCRVGSRRLMPIQQPRQRLPPLKKERQDAAERVVYIRVTELPYLRYFFKILPFIAAFPDFVCAKITV